MEYTNDQLRDRFNSLPENLKDVVTSLETTESVNNIGKEYHLHINQMGDLGKETGLFLLGITRPQDFIYQISKKLRISTELAREITKKLDEQIFKKVRESLQAVQGFSVENPNQEETETIITPTINDPAPMAPIETPIAPNQTTPEPTRDIFKEKMSALFTSTKEEVVQNEIKKPDLEQKTPPRHDPYRELA